METRICSTKEEFLETIGSFETNYGPILDPSQAEQLWDIWQYRLRRGQRQKLLYLPTWFTEKELGRRRPFIFATVEYDNPEKDAVLFSDCWYVNISIVENEVWDSGAVTTDHTLERLDISEDDEYLDDAGMIWIPRSLFTALEVTI